MSTSTAALRVRNIVIFSLLRELGQTTCYRCGQEIAAVGNLSLDHIEPWEGAEDAKVLFFDPANVAFSHRGCNSGATRCKRYGTNEERLQARAQQNRNWRRRNSERYVGQRRAKYLRTGT